MNKNNIQLKSVARKTGYILWFSLIIIVTIGIYSVSLGTNPNGEACRYNLWQPGDIYQWVWGGTPCAFTAEYYFSYSLIFVVYLIFDYVRRKIIGFNPSIGVRMGEIAFWFIANWIYLLWLTANDYGVLDAVMVGTSFLGMVLFMIPLAGLAVISRFLK